MKEKRVSGFIFTPDAEIKRNSLLTFWFDSPLECWRGFLNQKFKNYSLLTLIMNWDSFITTFEGKFRPGKSLKREEKYLIKSELERFKNNINNGMKSVSIRFGNFKKKNDFCLVGGSYSRSTKEFCLFYRALELTLELPFDLVLLNKIIRESGIKVKRVIIFSQRAFISTREIRRKYAHKLNEFLRKEERS